MVPTMSEQKDWPCPPWMHKGVRVRSKVEFSGVPKGTVGLVLPKDDWRDPSWLEYIEEGLRYLVDNCAEMYITSLAFPALGCGLGGLEWSTVHPLMERELSRLDTPVEIVEP